jgi:hypothetical protein
MVSGNAAPQKERKFSKLSLAGFIISVSSLICFILLIVATSRLRKQGVLVGIGIAAVFVALALSLILSISGFASARENKRKGSPFGLSGILISSITSCVLVCLLLSRACLSSLMTVSTATKAVPINTNSTVIDGVPRVFGEAIFLPCTIAELKQKGFDTDYSVTVHEIHMWPKDDREFFAEGPYINCYLEYDSYDYGNNTASDDSIVVAITFQEYNQAELDFHSISFDMTDEDIWNQFGVPAYEEDSKMNGHAAYYMGNHGLMYKFNYRFSNQRYEQDEDRDIWEITIATEEYMKNYVID